MRHYFLLLSLILAATTSAEPAKQEIRTGQYIRDANSGVLKIDSGGGNSLIFHIESSGGNCSSCTVSGEIVGGIGKAESWANDGSDSNCRISFSAEHSTISIQPTTEDECRPFCGMRAGFDGTYRSPPTACTNAGRQKLRDQFLRMYRSRQFSPAAKTLQSLISQCQEFMDWIEIDRVRNDLALAQYRNGDPQQCLTTLNTTLASNAKSENDLSLPPCDFDNYIGVAKSTWFNMALCSKAITKEK